MIICQLIVQLLVIVQNKKSVIGVLVEIRIENLQHTSHKPYRLKELPDYILIFSKLRSLISLTCYLCI